jgi:hypothetical protein
MVIHGVLLFYKRVPAVPTKYMSSIMGKKSYGLYENCNFAFMGIMLLDKLLRFCKASSVYTSEFYKVHTHTHTPGLYTS